MWSGRVGGVVRALVDVGVNSGGTAPGAAPGISEMFVVLEVVGAELLHATIPVRYGVPFLDWWVKGLSGVSASTSTAGDEIKLPADGSSWGPHAPA